jgi:YtkA-like protein
MLQRIRFALAVTAMLALAAACGAASQQQVENPAGPTLTAAQAVLAPPGSTLGGQRADDVLMWLVSNPAQPRQGDARIEAYLVGVDGQPVDNATVTFDTDMTNMSHGKYLVTAAPTGNGHYSSDVHFLMPGPWRIIAVVERPQQPTTKLRFEFKVDGP